MLKDHKFVKNRKGLHWFLLKYHINQLKMSKNHKFIKNRKGTTLVLIKISYKYNKNVKKSQIW